MDVDGTSGGRRRQRGRAGSSAGRLVLAGFLLGTAAAAQVGPLAEEAAGQAEVRNPTQPVLVLDTEGHHATIYALAFTPDGSQLLSAGMDKVVNVWDLAARDPRPSRRLRPPIWRGPRGIIFALALSPKADADGQRTLAVAGYGVQSTYGEIKLYRYPGEAPDSTGEVLALLSAGGGEDAEPAGHTGAVRALAFAPGGQYLASASFDGTVRIWDVDARKTLAVLRGHGGKPVSALGFAPDGDRLATAGADGSVVLWDVSTKSLLDHDRLMTAADGVESRRRVAEEFNRRSQVARAVPRGVDANPNAPAGAAINALAVSPDGRWVVIGRENGHLLRYDAADLGNESELPTTRTQGAVEGLAFSPDGSRLATSIAARRIRDPGERPNVACDVQLRRMPDGAVVGPALPATDNLCYTLAFSPDGRTLAYAGGDAQTITLAGLNDPPGRPVLRFDGRGKSVWDVGFTADGRSVGYSRTRDDVAQPPSRYWGFRPRTREVVGLDRADLRRALHTFAGSTLRPIDPTRIAVEDGRGVRTEIRLEPSDGRRWWSYSFIPPTPEHPRLAVAVGAEAGVVIFARGEGGQFRRTRVLAGHSGAVYALAPSPDGAWLATGSADQTVRLWTLAGCDARPTFGATFAPGEGGRQAANSVAERGFAEAMGLKKGDVVEQVFVAGKPREVAEGLAELDGAAPEVRLEFRVRRGADLVELGITKRDSPALSMFVADDREWVVWMPQGYYDTSIAGDRRFLGWHRNARNQNGDGANLAASTDYFTIDKFEAELRRPAVLDTLLDTADLGRALALVPPAVRDAPEVVRLDSPPRLAVEAPGRPAVGRLVVQAPNLRVLARAVTDELGAARRAVGTIRFLVDTQVQREVNPNQPEAAEPADLVVPEGIHEVSVVVASDGGRERTETFEVEYRPPAEAPPKPPAREPRLIVAAVGIDRFSGQSPLPAIPFAAEDARDVARFLTDSANHRFPHAEPPTVVVGAEATADGIRGILDAIDSHRESGDLGPGDTVVLMLESHVLTSDGAPRLLSADASGGLASEPAITAETLADRLGEIASYGCRVLVLLDGVHQNPSPPAGWDSRVGEFARALYRRNVIAFVASIQGPGQRIVPSGHGAFAQAILVSRDAASQTRLVPGQSGAMTLDRFRDQVEGTVGRLTGLRQVARCYIPGTVHPSTPIFDPAPPPAAEAPGE